MKALISFLLFFPCLAFADVSVPRAKQYAYTTWDMAAQGGSSTAHATGLTLPAGAVISDVWVYINTSFSASGPSSSLGISCGGSQNLMAYTNVSGVAPDRLYLGQATGATFNGAAAPIPLNTAALNFSQGFGSVPSACNVTFDVNSSAGYTPFTAGKATLWVEYFRL